MAGGMVLAMRSGVVLVIPVDSVEGAAVTVGRASWVNVAQHRVEELVVRGNGKKKNEPLYTHTC